MMYDVIVVGPVALARRWPCSSRARAIAWPSWIAPPSPAIFRTDM